VIIRILTGECQDIAFTFPSYHPQISYDIT